MLSPFRTRPLGSAAGRRRLLTLRIFFLLLLLWTMSGSSLLQFCVPPMAVVSPFRAWRYDPERVPIQQVVTQPYDKITPAMQERYYQASPYNLVRIILGKRLPEDGDAENIYTRAAASFQNWCQTGVFVAIPSLRSIAIPRCSGFLKAFLKTRRKPSGGASSLSAGSSNIPLASCSGTSRRWPSRRLTGWICCAPVEPTSVRSSCSTAGPARWMPCSIRRQPRHRSRYRGH